MEEKPVKALCGNCHKLVVPLPTGVIPTEGKWKTVGRCPHCTAMTWSLTPEKFKVEDKPKPPPKPKDSEYLECFECQYWKPRWSNGYRKETTSSYGMCRLSGKDAENNDRCNKGVRGRWT